MRGRSWKGPCFFSLLAFLAGVAVGRFALAPDIGDENNARSAAALASKQPEDSDAREAALEEALEGSWLATLQLAAKVNSLESLLEKLREQDFDKTQLVEGAIAGMSDEELRSIMASTAQLGAEDLEDVRDVRAFAARLAEVAMEDVVKPADETTGSSQVSFTTHPQTTDPESAARSRFDSGRGRIYAVFGTDRYEQGAVMVKWMRRDPPQIMLFERYPIVPGDAYGYVWMEPQEGWEPGQYQVDIFAADEAVTRLARGRYEVQ